MRGMIGGMEEGVLNGVRSTDRGVFLRGMKLIGSYIRAHPGPFAISVLGSMLYAAGAIGSTAVLGRVTNQVLVPAFEHGVPASSAWLGGSPSSASRRSAPSASACAGTSAACRANA